MERLVRDLSEVVDELQSDSPEALAARVVHKRRAVWWNFTVDTWMRSSVQSERLSKSLRDLLSAEIRLDDTHNTWELRVWSEVLADRKEQRGERGSLKWWGETIKEIVSFLERPAYRAPELPDMRAELRADFDGTLDDPESQTRKFEVLLED